MSHNFLMLNSDKTEVIVPKYIRDNNFVGIGLVFSTTVSNWGVNSHLKHISRTAVFHLHNIAKIWHILSEPDAEKVV